MSDLIHLLARQAKSSITGGVNGEQMIIPRFFWGECWRGELRGVDTVVVCRVTRYCEVTMWGTPRSAARSIDEAGVPITVA